jgi:hypothetical protein
MWTASSRKPDMTKSESVKFMVRFTGCNVRRAATTKFGEMKRSSGKVCRPNILMFGDYAWLQERTLAQNHAFDHFLKENSDRNIAVIEMGAGKAIPHYP